MLTFITSLYNEQDEIVDLMGHVWPYVDKLEIVDDGSTDDTRNLLITTMLKLQNEMDIKNYKCAITPIGHTGLCELGRIEALRHVPSNSWVLMLDADERLSPTILAGLRAYVEGLPASVTHIWFSQDEYLDGKYIKTFAKVKVFRKEAVTLPEIIHGDPQFVGESVSPGWSVRHRKSSVKQVQRETEYVETYDKLLKEGKIDEGQRDWFLGMHYFVRSKS